MSHWRVRLSPLPVFAESHWFESNHMLPPCRRWSGLWETSCNIPDVAIPILRSYQQGIQGVEVTLPGLELFSEDGHVIFPYFMYLLSIRGDHTGQGAILALG